ncbi:MAG: tetratricopeptide repeat protein [Bacteroidia bacterium]
MTKQKAKKESLVLPLDKSSSLRFADFKIQALILIIIGFIFYSNSFSNEYALDDGIVILKNDYVQQGFRGIKKIFKTDAYESFYRQMGAKQQLSGGRYRPFSIATFAVEQQLFQSNAKVKPPDDVAHVRHVMNVLFYILSVVFLLFFLRKFVFKENYLVAFLTCLIFLIHPLHTEVVANIKSRDEILSFLFIILTFTSVFSFRETKQKRFLIFGLLFYFLALLSKEYAITLLVLLPMLLYIIKSESTTESIIAVIGMLVVAGIYMAIRFSIVGKGATEENPDVLNNPYMFATHSEKWATKIEVLDHYLRLLFYPQPLSSDYSYNTIPYKSFENPLVWLSILIHLLLIAATVILFIRRNILSFALAFYLVHLFLVSNFLMDIGATMGERLIYHSSFGFAIIIGVALNWLLQKIPDINTKKVAGIFAVGVLVVLCGAKTIARNAEWKNDQTLFITDAETVPNSALVNGNAGKAFVDLSEMPENKAQEKELIEKGIYYLKRAVKIHPKYVNGYLNLGVCYFKQKNFEETKANWDKAKSLYPNNPLLKRNFDLLAAEYFNEGMTIGGKNPQEAIKLLEKAVEIAPQNADYWYNIGGAAFTMKDYEKARFAWTKTLELKRDYVQAQQGMNALPKK